MEFGKLKPDKSLSREPAEVLALKDLQSLLHDDMKLLFEDAVCSNFSDTNAGYYLTIDGDHGAIFNFRR